jgi:hypothetical protein
MLKCDAAKGHVTDMQYDVITFDTQTVESNSFHFDGGFLSKLKQFKDGPVRVVVSEIVVLEIFKHLVEKTRAARDAAISAHKKIAIEASIRCRRLILHVNLRFH